MDPALVKHLRQFGIPSFLLAIMIVVYVLFICFRAPYKQNKKLMKPRSEGKKALFGQQIPDLANTYDAEWLEYGTDKFNLAVFIRQEPTTFREKLHLLDELFGEIFGPLVGNRFRAYDLRVTVGNHCRTTEQFGAFHHLQVVIMLADMNLTKVFKNGWIQVELYNILY